MASQKKKRRPRIEYKQDSSCVRSLKSTSSLLNHNSYSKYWNQYQRDFNIPESVKFASSSVYTHYLLALLGTGHALLSRISEFEIEVEIEFGCHWVCFLKCRFQGPEVEGNFGSSNTDWYKAASSLNDQNRNRKPQTGSLNLVYEYQWYWGLHYVK